MKSKPIKQRSETEIKTAADIFRKAFGEGSENIPSSLAISRNRTGGDYHPVEVLRASEKPTQPAEGLQDEEWGDDPYPDTPTLDVVRQGAELGNAGDQVHLGIAYLNGAGVEKNPTEAAAWFLAAAKQGETEGHYALGTMLLNGQGIEKNVNEAVSHFRSAAENGHPHAQYNLGWCLANGVGVKSVDNAAAVHWFREAANQGHAFAQFNLGLALYNRTGGKSRTEAKKWFRKAAAQGFIPAKKILNGEMLP